jgi:formylglycine-generating enzyme required for sulfatase activity
MDLYEAPNAIGELPFVMFHFDEAASWCAARGKRLCFDDEWTEACAGPQGWSWPYGDTHEPGVCNDDKTWLAYNQDLLNGWPWSVETDAIETLGQLLDTVRAVGAGAKAAADHVEALYQGTVAGAKPGCVGSAGVYDLEGNVEEWTRRRDGGEPSFHGNLKGRYWAEPRTCQQGVITHGDTFRFYEIGFRCCRDAQNPG